MHCGLYAVHVRSPSARPPRTLTRMGLTARTSGVPRAREETGTSEDANTMCIASRSSKLSLAVRRYLAQRRARSELWQMQCAAIHDPCESDPFALARRLSLRLCPSFHSDMYRSDVPPPSSDFARQMRPCISAMDGIFELFTQGMAT